MGKIFIVRHGQDANNANHILGGRDDQSLTDLGREQAKAAAQKLKNKQIDIIYSSPLKRAYETAQIIAKILGIEKIEISDDLMEREMGALTGKPLTEIKKHAAKLLLTEKITYFLEASGAEDFPTLFKRGEKVLFEIKQKNPDKNILIVAHSDIGKMIRAVHYKRNWEDELRGDYFDNGDVLELS